MSPHALMLAGEVLCALSVAVFFGALVERARERMAVKVTVRKDQRR